MYRTRLLASHSSSLLLASFPPKTKHKALLLASALAAAPLALCEETQPGAVNAVAANAVAAESAAAAAEAATTTLAEAAATAAAATTSSSCTSATAACLAQLCQNQGSALLANPWDPTCASFVQCWSNQGGVQACPAGLVFNPARSYCDWK